MTLTETAAGARSITIDGLDANEVNSLVRFETDEFGADILNARIEFQPAAFPNTVFQPTNRNDN